MSDKKPINLWLISETIGEDWYMVYAKSRAEALKLIVNLHFDNVPVVEYVRDYKPIVRQVIV